MVQISRGFGVPTMWSVEEPDRCIKYLDRYVLEGRIIMVEKRPVSIGVFHEGLPKILTSCQCLYEKSRLQQFNGALSIELTNNNPNMRIIHRKFALILGKWVSEKEAVMLYLLQQNWWKKSKSLIQSVQMLNTIFGLAAHITEVIPYANKLVQFFQRKAWEESYGESLLQIQLLTALKNFMAALGYQSPICYNLLMPILPSVLNDNSPDELLEDSLQAMGSYSFSCHLNRSSAVGLFPMFDGILERSFDHLELAASIIEGYIVLGEFEFSNMHAPTLARVLDLVVGNVNNKGLLSILPLVDVIVHVVNSRSSYETKAVNGRMIE
ncbi:hypothetical protein OROMI_006803 [Orobanche minor]